jgi:hypothetical protein
VLPSRQVGDVKRGLHDVVAVLVGEHVVDAQLAPVRLALLAVLTGVRAKGQVDQCVEQLVDLVGVVPVLLSDFLKHADGILVQFAAIALNGQIGALELDEVEDGDLRLVLAVL